jgi:hypothetical protein
MAKRKPPPEMASLDVIVLRYMGKAIDDWIRRYPQRNCRTSEVLAGRAQTDREFYDGLSTPDLFLNGIAHLCPQRALWLVMRTLRDLTSGMGSKVIRDAKTVALDDEASQAELRVQLGVIEDWHSYDAFPKEDKALGSALYMLLRWRLGYVSAPEVATRIVHRIGRQLRIMGKVPEKVEVKDVTLAYLKKSLDFDEWLKGVKEEAYVEKPYADFPKYLPIK